MKPAKTTSRTEQLTIESRSALARLAAAENINVEHSTTVETAMFNVESRTLILPLWDGMTKPTYDMLTFHEVGHALFTPSDLDVIANAVDYLTDGNNALAPIAQSYLNVVEDPRIEKLIKRQFPGSRKDFTAGYDHMHNSLNLFEVKDRDVNAMRLIDKVNLHFKIGWLLPELDFTATEMGYLTTIAKAESFADVVAIAKVLFDLEKQNQENKSGDGEGDDDKKESGDGDADENQSGESGENESGEQGEGDSAKADDDSDSDDDGDAGKGEDDSADDGDDSADGESGKGDKSDESGEKADGKSDEQGDGKPESGESDEQADGDQDSSDVTKSVSGGTNESQNRDVRETGESGAGQTASVSPESMKSETDDALSNALKNRVNKAGGTPQYGDLPDYDLDKVIRPWRDVRDSQESFFANRPATGAMNKKWAKFNGETKKVVQYLANQFKRKQAAQNYARTRTARSGKIDCNRLAYHRTADDIFKNLELTSKGKNHGLVMYIDWSGSMADVIQSTVEQLIQIASFARKVGIPFEVYSFSDVSPSNTRRTDQVKNEKGNTIQASSFGLHNYLSSEMRTPEFNAAAFRIWRIAGELGRSYSSNGVPSEDRMTCTPLHEAMMASIQMAPAFRVKHKVEILNVIFLTDGGSSYGLSTRDANNRYGGGSLVIRHKQTNAQIEDTGNGNAALMSILKNTAGVNTIGFHYPGSSYTRYAAATTERNASWKKNGFVESDEVGFDSYFLIRPDKFKEESTSMKDAKNFTEYMKSQVLNKVLLGRFVEMIASNQS